MYLPVTTFIIASPNVFGSLSSFSPPFCPDNLSEFIFFFVIQ